MKAFIAPLKPFSFSARKRYHVGFVGSVRVPPSPLLLRSRFRAVRCDTAELTAGSFFITLER